jgi:hypothetical protein
MSLTHRIAALVTPDVSDRYCVVPMIAVDI